MSLPSPLSAFLPPCARRSRRPSGASVRQPAQPVVEHATLANGLRVVTTRRPDAETVAVTLAIRAGARFENDFTASAAHFLEHMYLQGTPSRPNRDAVMRTVTARGGTHDYGGKLVWYANPAEKSSIRDAIERSLNVADTPDLLTQVRDHFTWERSARALLKVYEAVLTGRESQGLTSPSFPLAA